MHVLFVASVPIPPRIRLITTVACSNYVQHASLGPWKRNIHATSIHLSASLRLWMTEAFSV